MPIITSDISDALAIGWGNVPGVERITAFGNNPDVDSGAVPADIWSGTGLYPWMTAATSLEIVSSSANDAAAGTGARTVRIIGLDANYAEISSTVTLNGITPVAIPIQFFRINRADVMTAGTGQVNAGTLTIRNAGAGTTRALIEIGYGITRQSQYTVPAGKTLQIVTYINSITNPTSTRDATLITWARLSTGVIRQVADVSVDGNPVIYSLASPTVLNEKTDFSIRVIFASTTNMNISSGFAGVLRSNNA